MGDSRDLSTLINMGALVPTAVLRADQWWRLFSAPLLHNSLLHLTLNVTLFFWFGPRFEARFGGWPVVGLFLLVNSSAMLLVTLGTAANLLPRQTIAVGASASATALLVWLLAQGRARDLLTARGIVLVLGALLYLVLQQNAGGLLPIAQTVLWIWGVVVGVGAMLVRNIITK